VKKRVGGHESTLRHFYVGAKGIQLGPPLSEFHGVLTGVPEHSGAPKAPKSRRE